MTTIDTSDAAERFSLLDMDLPTALAPAVRMAPLAPVAPVVAAPVATAPARTDVRIVAYPVDSRNRPVVGRLAVVTPFVRGFPAAVKNGTDAQWDSNGASIPSDARGVWHFDARNLPVVRRHLVEFYGFDGGPVPTATPVATPAPVAPAPVAPVAPAPAPAPAAAVTQPIPFVPASELARERLAAVAAADSALAEDLAPVVDAGQRMAAAAVGRGFRPARTVSTALAATDKTPTTVREAITAGQVVAGAKAEGQGSLMGWTGRREATRATLVECLRRAGAPEEWAPASKSAHAHAGAAVNALNRQGFVSRIDRSISRQDRRAVAGRWIVAPVNNGGSVGDSVGRIALTVTLSTAGSLTCEGDWRLTAEVTEEFDRLRNAEVYSAGDVTAWLSSLLSQRLGAVRMAQAWYVRHGQVEMAEAILTSVSESGWGVDWLLPALPVATSAQLRTGLATGLIREAGEVLADLEAQRTAATAAKRADIGPRAAMTLLTRLRTVAERVGQYAVILGEDQVATVRASIVAATAVVEPLCSDTSQRGAVLEMD